ncbi:MAG: hypothetical protein WKG07_26305 [Hymenobacter sp.]
MSDAEPRFSPDGKLLAFERDAKELRILDLAAKQERVAATGLFGRPPLSAGPLRSRGRQMGAGWRSRPTARGALPTCRWCRRRAARPGRSAFWRTPTATR